MGKKEGGHWRKVEGDMGKYLPSLHPGQHPDKEMSTDSYKYILTLLSHSPPHWKQSVGWKTKKNKYKQKPAFLSWGAGVEIKNKVNTLKKGFVSRQAFVFRLHCVGTVK